MEKEIKCSKCNIGTLKKCEYEGRIVLGCDECRYFEELPTIDLLVKDLFKMVYMWGRVGVKVDHTAPAYQSSIKALLNHKEK